LDSFLTDWPEPELSQMRSELEALTKARTILNEAGGSPEGATVDFVRPQTAELAGIAAAIVPPGGTLDHKLDSMAQTREHLLPESGSPDGQETPLPAMAIAGYEILGVLGRGAMGIVYKARQRGLNRLVALKMILSGEHAAAYERARFKSEAEAVAQLQHANIVQIYEVGEDEGRPFFSLEFVDGISLDKKVQGTPLAPKEAASLSRLLALAMDYAHQRGIIHRDLKPANVLLTVDGTPKIGDFGLAKRLENDSGQTRTGTVLGTPSYMAPEQAEGKIDKVGPLADVYSLGAVLYDLLTGRAPFRGTTLLETLEQVRTREPVRPLELQPNVPRDLETICLKCLQKDPHRRYQCAGALADDLDRFLKNEPILARPVGRIERAWRWCKRNPRIAGLSAAVVLLVIIWAATSSILAWNLKLQTDQAVKNEKEAQQQTILANKNEKEAQKQTIIARKKEKTAKDTADAAVQEMVHLGAMLQNRLQSKRLSILAPPEVQRLRAEILDTLRKSLRIVSARIEAAEATTFAEAASYQSLGDLLKKLGQGKEAQAAYQKAHELVKKQADANPFSDLARGNLGLLIQRLGDVPFEVNGDARTAMDYYRQARDVHWDIYANPKDGFYKKLALQRIISHDDIHLGETQLALGMPAEARKSFEEALAFRLAWLEANPKKGPTNNVARSWVMQAHYDLGIAASHLADGRTAKEHFEKALRIGAALVKETKYWDYYADLADVQGVQGDALFRLGKNKEAEKSYRESLANLKQALKLNPDDLTRQGLLAQTHERIAVVAKRLKNNSDADKHFQEAFKLRKEMYLLQENNPMYQAAFALAGARIGKIVPADHFAAKFRPAMEKSPELLLQLARCWSLCASIDSPQKDQYLKKGMEALKAATREDYKDVVVLQTDADLEALRPAPAFQSVITLVKSRY
jgi:serine/threonine-protein kinase